LLVQSLLRVTPTGVLVERTEQEVLNRMRLDPWKVVARWMQKVMQRRRGKESKGKM